MKKIAILCGGYSSEFDISIKSATTILQYFPKELEGFLIKITRDKWTANFRNQEYEVHPWEFTFQVEGETIQPDAVIIYIHGNPGENGKLMAFFEMKGIPTINSNALASHLSFDKWYCNQFLRNFGIPVADSILLRKKSHYTQQEIIQRLGLPCFVKPTDSGSSYGISKVTAESELLSAIDTAFKEGETVVVEKFLKGTEVTCAVYKTDEGIQALPLVEIVSENEFFDYEAKYLGKSQEICPARVDDHLKEKVQAVAKEVYQLLNLGSIARVDFMVVKGEPYVIEVNTTPGFSPASLVPKMLQEAQISIEEFWRKIINFELDL